MSAEVIRISSTELGGEFAFCKTLGEVVSELEKKVKAQGRVVCTISVNGMRLNETDEQRLAATSVAELKNIEFETEDPAELMRSTLHSQAQMAAEISRVSLLAAEAFRRLDLNPAQNLLISLLDGCRWFTDGLVALKSAPSGLLKFPFDENQWSLAESEFRRVVSEILAAVERRDYVLIADLLEYDLGNSLDRWRALLTR
jgi:hypothetical protein